MPNVEKQNLAKRFERYGAVSLSTYRTQNADVNDTEAWNNYVLQLVYADEATIDDEDNHILYERVTQNCTFDFREMKVLCVKPIDSECFLHVNIPVVNSAPLSFVIGQDGLIEPLDIELYANMIEEETANDSE